MSCAFGTWAVLRWISVARARFGAGLVSALGGSGLGTSCGSGLGGSALGGSGWGLGGGGSGLACRGPPFGGRASGLPPPTVLPSDRRRLSGRISSTGLGWSWTVRDDRAGANTSNPTAAAWMPREVSRYRVFDGIIAVWGAACRCGNG
ncbi:MAG: hypothetical protein FJ396_04510 [Verrucomicrobia bacterium]|nr:hypothetical protein [Verrucomicrobiota bacterium]